MRPTWRFIPLSGEWVGNLRGKMGIQFVLAAIFVAGLSGCGVVRNYVAELDQTRAVSFCEQKRSNPAVGVLKGKLAIVSLDEITPDMLALDEVPTAQDVEAIRVLARAINANAVTAPTGSRRITGRHSRRRARGSHSSTIW